MLNIIQKPSPNFGDRKGYKPELFVIHIMAGSLSGTDSWFATPASKVSSHFGVGLKGEVHQYVQLDKAAWTNGIINKPSLELLKAPNINPNWYTLTIECEGHDLKNAPEAQISAICELLQRFGKEYDIPLDRDHIIGHYQIDSVKKPNCPSTDKSILDQIVARVQTPNVVKAKQLLEEALKLL